MRLKLALAALIATLGSTLVAPAAAHAAPDSSACSAAGTYSYLYGHTYRLIGNVDNYRYWQVVTYNGHYVRSYVVRCDGTTIDWSADLNPTGTYCGTSTSGQYRHAGDGLISYWEPGMIFPVEDLYRYTHVSRWVQIGWYGSWMYLRSEVALC